MLGQILTVTAARLAEHFVQSSPATSRHPRGATLWLVAALPLLVGLIYARSLPNELVWDDRQLIVQNRYLEQGAIGEIVTHGIFSGAGREFGFYRPLQILTYHLDLSLWGRRPIRPWSLRATNILLHGLNALLVLRLLRRLFPSRPTAGWIAALLFAAHPLASESVVYVAGRADLLLVAAGLASILFLLDFAARRRPWYLAASYVCFGLALLAKEAALIIPALLLLTLLVDRARSAVATNGGALKGRSRGGERSARWWVQARPIAGHLLLLATYLLLRTRLLGATTPPALLAEGPPALLQVFATYASYARLLLWPDVLQMERLTLPDPWRDPGFLLPWLVLLLASVALLANRRTRRAALFGSGWFVVALLPVSNLWRLNAAMAEHWLYLPGIGLLWLVGLTFEAAAERVGGRRRIVWGIVAVAVILLGGRTVARCDDWRTSESIFAATLRHAPGSARAHTGLGAALGRRGQLGEAVAHLRQALAIDPNSTDACNNLGAAYGRLGQLDSCVVYLERALLLEPHNADTHSNLGNTYAIRGETAAAARAYREALRLDPARASTHFSLGRVCRTLGEHDEARRAFTSFLHLAAGNASLAEQVAFAQQALDSLPR